MKRIIGILCAGALFGAGLALSGMTNPARVIGFLDVTGTWDPALAFVMGGALATFGASMVLQRRLGRGRGWFGTRLPEADRDPVDPRLIAGAVIFGIGWGVGGFCPGPALANLAAWRTEAVAFVPAMAVGMALSRLLFATDRD